MSRTTRTVDKRKQLKAKTAAKRARIAEANMDGPRIGKETAATQVAQARRDAKAKRAKRVTAARRAAVVKATSAPKPNADNKAKSKPKAKPKKKVKYAKPRVDRKSPIIEVRASSDVQGSAKLDKQVEGAVLSGLGHLVAGLTRIDVYLTDENAAKETLNDKRCQIEARVENRRPKSASATADTVEKALALAIGKMKRKLASRLGRRRATRGRA